MDLHATVGGKAGLSQAQMEAALGCGDASVLNAREQLAMDYADGVSATPVSVSDELFAQLQQHYDEREILELTSFIAHENYNAKMNRPLRVEANDLCPLPLPSPQSNRVATAAV